MHPPILWNDEEVQNAEALGFSKSGTEPQPSQFLPVSDITQGNYFSLFPQQYDRNKILTRLRALIITYMKVTRRRVGSQERLICIHYIRAHLSGPLNFSHFDVIVYMLFPLYLLTWDFYVYFIWLWKLRTLFSLFNLIIEKNY